MVLNAAARELEDAATAFRSAAGVLNRTPSRANGYLAELDRAYQVQWESQAGDAFRELVGSLQFPGHLVSTESQELASAAESIAADLSRYAQTAREVAAMVAALSAVDLPGLAKEMGEQRLDTLRSQAEEAVIDGARFVSFLEDNGGIPVLLREAAGRVW